MVDEDDLTPRGALARELGVAAVALGAAHAAATIGTDRQLAPDRLRRHERQLVAIALARADEPLIKTQELRLVLLGHALVGECSLHAADVVRAALHDGSGDVESRGLARER